MIEIKNLCKTFKRDEIKATALNDISFTLEDKGFVFIVGKSGSGKSTLLNIIGGLDNATSGEIIADGNNLFKFDKNEYDKYRNSYIGYIFQEFYLIEQLTLEQNVGISLDLANKSNNDSVKQAIEKVGLKGLEQRYIYELSGGQRQRVAIARALVKSPHLILADEPTGNLDSKNADQILKLLKKISKEKLVIIVSHNMESAYKYADRIIELADGKIISDEDRIKNYSNYWSINDNVLKLPYCKPLEDSELSEINTHLEKGNVKKIEQLNSGFIPHVNNQKNKTRKIRLEKNTISFKKSLTLATRFFKRNKLSTTFTILLTTLIILILGTCQFFISYDSAKSVNTVLVESNEDAFIIYKGKYGNETKTWLTIDTPTRASIDDIELFKQTEYKGNVYPLYNFSLPISQSQLVNELALYEKSNLTNFYIKETYGTLVTDEQYLIKLFGKDGKLNVLAGNLIDKPYGVIITDFVADSIINQFPKIYASYEDLIGEYNPNGYVRNYINAVIDTGYKEKYGDYIQEYIKEAKEIQNGTRAWMSNAEKANEFQQYAKKYIGLNYSLNSNFASEIMNKEARDYATLNYTLLTFEDGTNFYLSSSQVYLGSKLNYDLNDNEVIVGLTLYNKLFKTSYKTDTVPETIEPQIIKVEKFVDKNELEIKDPILELELKVVGISTDKTGLSNVFISEENFEKIREAQTFVYGYYFDDPSTAGHVYTTAKANLYSNNSSLYKSVGTVCDVIDVFDDFMVLITVVLCLICVLLLIRFGFSNIRKNKYEIGVIFALGGNSKAIVRIFLSQILFVGALISVFSSLALFFLTKSTDSLIIDAMIRFVNDKNIATITIIEFIPYIVIFDILMILGVTLIAAIVPTLYLRNMKPINIIKTKD